MVGIKVTFLVGLGTGHTLPGEGQTLTNHPSHRRGCRGLRAHTPCQIQRLAELLPKRQHVSSGFGAGRQVRVQTHLTEHQVINPATYRTAQHISTEDLLDHTVSPLGLTIRLGMVGRGMEQLGSQPGEQLLPEAAHEAGIPVSNDLARHAVLAHHPLEEQISSLGSSDGMVDRDKCDTFGGLIYHSHGTIKPPDQGQPKHEVHGITVEPFGGWFQGL